MELDNVDGVEGKLKVWIRRVWTLEMVSFTFAFVFNVVRRNRADTFPRVSSACDEDQSSRK